MTKRFLFTILLTTALVAGGWAQNPPAPLGPKLPVQDLPWSPPSPRPPDFNGDGIIDRDELKLQSKIEEAAAKLTPQLMRELEAAKKRPPVGKRSKGDSWDQLMKECDLDGDGRLNKKEAKLFRQRLSGGR